MGRRVTCLVAAYAVVRSVCMCTRVEHPKLPTQQPTPLVEHVHVDALLAVRHYVLLVRARGEGGLPDTREDTRLA